MTYLENKAPAEENTTEKRGLKAMPGCWPLPVILTADQPTDWLSPEKMYSDMLPEVVADLEARPA